MNGSFGRGCAHSDLMNSMELSATGGLVTKKSGTVESLVVVSLLLGATGVAVGAGGLAIALQNQNQAVLSVPADERVTLIVQHRLSCVAGRRCGYLESRGH